MGLLVGGARTERVEAAERRTEGRSQSVVFVSGYSRRSFTNCAGDWDPMRRALRGYGHHRDLVTVALYAKHRDRDGLPAFFGKPGVADVHAVHSTGLHQESTQRGGHVESQESTDLDSHNPDAPIEHLGYHLAWYLYERHSRRGETVDVVAWSMGGLVIRYALAQVELGHPDFPPRLLVEDVVTLGTPHGGARSFTGFGSSVQAAQLQGGSPLLRWLEQHAWEPDGARGTDWTTMGSDEDGIVAADRAAATDRDRDPTSKYFGSSHKVWYTDPNGIDHNGLRHRNAAERDARFSTAEAWEAFAGQPFNVAPDGQANWPVRQTDLSLTSGDQ